MIDTHTHLYMGAYSEPEQAPESLAGQLAAVERACAAGVGTMITPNVDLQSIEPMKRLWKAAPEKVRMAMGLHPTEIGEDWRATLSPILEELRGCDKQYENDLDNPNRKVYEGDKFGYNYDIHAIKANAWIQNMINLAHWDINYGVDMSYTQFYRYGHMRNGRSPQNSLGRGATHRFDNAVAKVGATYKIDGRNYIMAHAEYGTHAPLIESVYISPRIKDDIIADPKSERILSADLSYSWNYRRFRGTITGYWTEFYDAV